MPQWRHGKSIRPDRLPLLAILPQALLPAVFPGIMAGVFLHGLAHAGQQASRFIRLQGSPPSVCADDGGAQPFFSPE